jgi:hypothetical protein
MSQVGHAARFHIGASLRRHLKPDGGIESTYGDVKSVTAASVGVLWHGIRYPVDKQALVWTRAAYARESGLRMALAPALRRLDEPVRDEIARLMDISGLWVRSVGDRHRNKREIQKLVREIVPQLRGPSRDEHSLARMDAQ